MKVNIVTHEPGVISKEAFKTGFVIEPSDLIVDLACWNTGGFSLWADDIGVDFHIKTPNEVIEKFFKHWDEKVEITYG